MMSRPPIERRVTPWRPVWWADPRIAAFRIWQEFDGHRWYQMHEWERHDGTRYADGWIVGTRQWSSVSLPATEAAPDDAPGLTDDEIAYLIERLRGANDPLGSSALAKLAAMRGRA